ncbi:hypothetical protein PG993_000768 [Apiospora rasikravindrae]|uniref:RRM domain-containing protein n=1 Tax=Apiospora rasikravindrae TaxID=990691 RepID=A0ABR1U9H8_9PEZI
MASYNNHAASGQQSSPDQLVYDPSIWQAPQAPIAPSGSGNVAFVGSGNHPPVDHHNGVGVNYQEPNGSNNWHPNPGASNVADFTGQHYATTGNWAPSPGQHPNPPGQYHPTSVRTLAPPPGLGYPVNQRPQGQNGYTSMSEHPQPMGFVDQHRPHQEFVDPGHQTMQTTVQHPQPAGFHNRAAANNAIARPRPANQRAAFPPARVQFQAGPDRASHPNDGVELDPNFQFSANYRGSRQSRLNFSANVDDGANCSLFVRGLPPTCTPNMLLRQIRGCGTKVWALHINAPDARNPRHCAAKLVFFQRCGVDWVYDQIEAGTFCIADARGREYFPNAVYNNIKSAPMDPTIPSSRVVVVVGPASIVIVDALNQFFRANFRFEVDDVFVTHDQDGWRALEFHFSSTRCQAENAMQELERLQAMGPREGPETSAL